MILCALATGHRLDTSVRVGGITDTTPEPGRRAESLSLTDPIAKRCKFILNSTGAVGFYNGKTRTAVKPRIMDVDVGRRDGATCIDFVEICWRSQREDVIRRLRCAKQKANHGRLLITHRDCGPMACRAGGMRAPHISRRSATKQRTR